MLWTAGKVGCDMQTVEAGMLQRVQVVQMLSMNGLDASQLQTNGMTSFIIDVDQVSVVSYVYQYVGTGFELRRPVLSKVSWHYHHYSHVFHMKHDGTLIELLTHVC